MALKPCRECGREVSTEAATCPQCGVGHPALAAEEAALKIRPEPIRSPPVATASASRGRTRRRPLLLFLAIPITIWAAPSAYYGAVTPCGWLGKSLRREMAVAIATEPNGILVPLIAEARIDQTVGALRPADCIKALLVRAGPVERTPGFRATEAGLSSDLKNLAAVQEIYLLDHGSYATRLAELDYRPSPGNVIEIVFVSPTGWVMRATNSRYDLTCLIFDGSPQGAAAVPGLPEVPGRVACTRE